MNPRRPSLSSEKIAYWFFRLNGCLNLVNFLIHHEHRGHEGTDVDVLAVRFPYRQELALSGKPMEDYPDFQSDGRIDLIVAEVKMSLCRLNGPWTNPEKQNMLRVLHALGAFLDNLVDVVTKSLYEHQYYEDNLYRCRLFALGMDKNDSLAPAVIQITWREILEFIHERFTEFERYKSQHRQWDHVGQTLFRNAVRNRQDSEAFVEKTLELIVG